MDERVSAAECLGELPSVAVRASQGVLDLYEAIRQARAAGATYDQLVAATGMARGNVQRVVSGQFPRFAMDGA